MQRTSTTSGPFILRLDTGNLEISKNNCWFPRNHAADWHCVILAAVKRVRKVHYSIELRTNKQGVLTFGLTLATSECPVYLRFSTPRFMCCTIEEIPFLITTTDRFCHDSTNPVPLASLRGDLKGLYMIHCTAIVISYSERRTLIRTWACRSAS